MNKKRIYDFVFGLGQSCACSQALRVAGLQYASFPFDWIGGPTLREPVRVIVSGFKGWMRRDAFMHIGDRLHPQGRIYRNVETELIYSHEVPLGGSMDESYELMMKKYARRIRRFQRMMSGRKRILVVRLAVPGLAEELDSDLIDARRELTAAYPEASIDILYLVNRKGVSWARERRAGKGVVVAELDYMEKGVSDPNPLVPDLGALESYLRTYSCLDYRTRRERSSFKGRKDYRNLFAVKTPLPQRPNKVWDYGPAAFELKPLYFSESFKDNNRFREEMDRAVKRVLDSGVYIDGQQLKTVEREVGRYVGAPYTVTFSSPEELRRALHSVGVAQDVAVDFSCAVGAGVGKRTLGKKVKAAFCFLDAKSNVNVPGNIGFLITSDRKLAAAVRASVHPADELSCALLRVRLRHLDGDNLRRLDIKKRYMREITGGSFCTTLVRKGGFRDLVGVCFRVKDAASCCRAIVGLGCECRVSGEEVVLPNSPSLSNEKIGAIVKIVNGFG